VLGRGELVSLRGENFPLLRLHHLFEITGATTDPTQGLVTIIENQGRKVGLLVDDLLGHAQLVVKGLEGHFRRVEGLVGATILGDGNVALILDVQRLIRIANSSERSAPRGDTQGAAA
jgi:two-component system chemotaxis sensor kinase CheA